MCSHWRRSGTTIEDVALQERAPTRCPAVIYLGDALTHSAIDIGDHQRLQADHDRLAGENTSLQRRMQQQDHLITELREDLAASRRAHTEDNERNTLSDATVSLHGKQR